MVVPLTAMAVSLLVIAALRPLAPTVGLIDKPGGRKTHHGDVPVVGGIGMFVALVAGAGAMPVTDRDALPLLGACALLLAVGLADDRFVVSVRLRLIAHLLAALLAMAMLDRGVGLSLGHALGPNETLLTGAPALMLAALLIGGAINAFNMMDGMDGLAGTMALVPLAVFAGVAYAVDPFVHYVCLAGIGAVLGFLLFNLPARFNRAWRVFMGDAGSTMLGFLLAALSLRLTQESAALAPATVLWLVALPITDLLWTIVRRVARGRSPFAPDRSHLHHRLLDAGLGVRASFAVLTGLAAALAAAGLAMHMGRVPEWVQFYGFVATATLLAFAFSRADRLAARAPAAWRRLPDAQEQATLGANRTLAGD